MNCVVLTPVEQVGCRPAFFGRNKHTTRASSLLGSTKIDRDLNFEWVAWFPRAYSPRSFAGIFKQIAEITSYRPTSPLRIPASERQISSVWPTTIIGIWKAGMAVRLRDESSRNRCASPKCHRTRGPLRISNIQFEAERRELKHRQAHVWTICVESFRLVLGRTRPVRRHQDSCRRFGMSRGFS